MTKTIRKTFKLPGDLWASISRRSGDISSHLGMAEVTDSQLVGYLLSRGLCDISATDGRPTRARADREIEIDLSHLSPDPAADRHRYNPELLGAFMLWAFPGLKEKRINKWLLTLQRYPAEYGNCAMYRTLENRETVETPTGYSISVLEGLNGKDVQDYLDGVEKPQKRPPRPAHRQEPQQGGPSDLIAAQERRNAERPAEDAARAVLLKEHQELCHKAWDAATVEEKAEMEAEAQLSPAVKFSRGKQKDLAIRGAKMAIIAKRRGIERPI